MSQADQTQDQTNQSQQTQQVQQGSDQTQQPTQVAQVEQIGEQPKPADDAGSNKDEATGVVTYEPTGDAGLDLALGFLGRLGFDLDHPAMQAADGGDFSLLKAELALLGDKAQGWEQVIAVGEKAFNSQKEAYAARAEADRKAIYEAAGGEQQWTAVKEWAASNVDATQKEQINAALGQGGLVAEAMAAYLASQYSQATNVNRQGRSAVKEDAGKASVSTDALSPRQYTDAVKELRAKLGPAFEASPEYAQLRDRRMRWQG